MKEYKTVLVPAEQGWGGSKGTADTSALDATLNQMSRDGWELQLIENLNHTAGSSSLLCVFARESKS
ncbi:MAG: DUF4177 domain-containing protein [Verrucomicrobiota bacterium]